MRRTFSLFALSTAIVASIATSGTQAWTDSTTGEYAFEIAEGPQYEVQWRAILDDVAYDQWIDDELVVTVHLESAGSSTIELRFTVDGSTNTRTMDVGPDQPATMTFNRQQLREDALAVEWNSYETDILLTAEVEGDDATVDVSAVWHFEGAPNMGTANLSMSL